MSVENQAGESTPRKQLENITELITAYSARVPDASNASQVVSFGTSGHRGTSVDGSFNEAHIVSITAAIIEYRKAQNITGPIFVGRDTHALSLPAERTALEVLAGAGVETRTAANDLVTPTPAISHAILVHNESESSPQSDGIIITPSHNPPRDGGFKYNPPSGGPADTDVTNAIQTRANEILKNEWRSVPRGSIDAPCISRLSFVSQYTKDLEAVIDIGAIKRAGVRIGVHPLGGSALAYWDEIKKIFELNIEIIDRTIDPTFGFIPLDHDGVIRMDCSSPYVMAGVVKHQDRFDVAIGTDPDADRHGIVVPVYGLLNPNHYLAVAIDYLLAHRPEWPKSARVGKTVVSSSIIDRVVTAHGREVYEVPVGFKWFVSGLLHGDLVFGGEESAGASFLRINGKPWSTDKDGILLGLLAAEITAVTGKNPGAHFKEITLKHGQPFYKRIDRAATKAQKDRIKQLNAENVHMTTLAGEEILRVLSSAPGNNAPIGGVKIVTQSGWCAVRPSGTEDICKLYAESLKSEEHLTQIIEQGAALLASD